MSEQRLLQIIADECRASPAYEAQGSSVKAKYGSGFKDTFYILTLRGLVDKCSTGAILLTKEARTLIR